MRNNVISNTVYLTHQKREWTVTLINWKNVNSWWWRRDHVIYGRNIPHPFIVYGVALFLFIHAFSHFYSWKLKDLIMWAKIELALTVHTMVQCIGAHALKWRALASSLVLCSCVSFQFEHWNELQPEIISQTMNAVWNSLCAHLSLKCFISAAVKYITAPQVGAFRRTCPYCSTDVCIGTCVCMCVYVCHLKGILVKQMGVDSNYWSNLGA